MNKNPKRCNRCGKTLKKEYFTLMICDLCVVPRSPELSPGENIVDIKSLPDYQVTSNGRVFSKLSYRFLTSSLSSTGYLIIRLKKPFKVTRSVHRLVAEHFLDNSNRYKCVNHKNGNKLDNRVENLEWCSHKQNNNHAIETGLHNPFGENSGNSKLTNAQVLEIRRLYKETKVSYRKLAEIFKVSFGNIGDIVNRRRWKHI
jgi:hypothetical protein